MSLADRQAASSRQGKAYTKKAGEWLEANGWHILSRDWTHPQVKVHIDYSAKFGDTGVPWYVICHGSWESPRNGIMRTDTLKKAIAVAYLLSTVGERCPLLLVTSDLPKPGSVGDAWLHRAWPLFGDVLVVAP